MLKWNGVATKHLRFFVAEFILSNVEGLLRMTGMFILLGVLNKKG